MLTQRSVFRTALLVLILFIACGNNVAESPDPVKGEQGMVVSADSIATEVGLQILKAGGNAVDAAVAVGFALAVTYPRAGNIGGGGFMVIHLESGENTTIDYREKAPSGAYRDMFLTEEGEYDPEISTTGILSAGVPGSVAGMIYALENYGTMDLEDVIQPAIDLAENGFILPEHTARSIKYQLTRFMQFPSSMKVFTKDSSAYEAGDLFIQKDLAFTLKQIRENGKAGFYEGEVADLIVAQMDSMGGLITHEDLQEYEPVERDPVYGTYRGYDIVSMPPPSSGGAALVQMLNVLENFDVEREQWGSSLYIHRLVEAMKRAYADRSKHLGDMDYYDVPLAWLTSKAYGEHIAHQITDSATVSDSLHPGKPYPYESDETTHYSIADKYGNAVSVTTTINFSYGSGLVVEGAGFLLNDEMDDFSAKPNTPNAFGLLGSEANAIEPGKRMLSSMTPTIVLKDNKPYIIIGTPGGATIITVVLQVILNCIDFGMDIQQAINMPRIHHQWKPDEIFYENFGMPIDVKENLIRRGHSIGGTRMLGLAEGIMINHNTGIMFGATDARGNGLAKGF